jgi:exosortase
MAPFPARQRLLLASASLAAALQIGVALHLDAPEYLGALVVGWGGALYLLSRDLPRAAMPSTPFEVVLGAAWLLVTCAVTIAGWHRYHPVDRSLPIAAGLGIGTAFFGLRGLRQHVRVGALLSVSFLDPLPWAVRRVIMPSLETAATAETLLRVVGFPVTRQGTFLHAPGATVEVMGVCSGLESITQLLVLVVLIVCLLRPTFRQSVLLATVAIVVGFLVNSARVAFLTFIASRAPYYWGFWERPGLGSNLFPVVATTLACSAWWLVLRAREMPAMGPASAPRRPVASHARVVALTRSVIGSGSRHGGETTHSIGHRGHE